MFEYLFRLAMAECVGAQFLLELFGCRDEEFIRKCIPWLESQFRLKQLIDRGWDEGAGAFDICHLFPPMTGEQHHALWADGYAVAYAILEDPWDACEAVQQATLKMQRLPYVPDNPRGYFLRTVEHCAIDIQRRRHVRRREVQSHQGVPANAESPDAPPDGILIREEERSLVNSAVAQLPGALHETVTLYYFEGVPAKDIAKRFGISTERVHGRLCEARTLLRAALEPLLLPG